MGHPSRESSLNNLGTSWLTYYPKPKLLRLVNPSQTHSLSERHKSHLLWSLLGASPLWGSCRSDTKLVLLLLIHVRSLSVVDQPKDLEGKKGPLSLPCSTLAMSAQLACESQLLRRDAGQGLSQGTGQVPLRANTESRRAGGLLWIEPWARRDRAEPKPMARCKVMGKGRLC